LFAFRYQNVLLNTPNYDDDHFIFTFYIYTYYSTSNEEYGVSIHRKNAGWAIDSNANLPILPYNISNFVFVLWNLNIFTSSVRRLLLQVSRTITVHTRHARARIIYLIYTREFLVNTQFENHNLLMYFYSQLSKATHHICIFSNYVILQPLVCW